MESFALDVNLRDVDIGKYRKTVRRVKVLGETLQRSEWVNTVRQRAGLQLSHPVQRLRREVFGHLRTSIDRLRSTSP